MVQPLTSATPEELLKFWDAIIEIDNTLRFEERYTQKTLQVPDMEGFVRPLHTVVRLLITHLILSSAELNRAICASLFVYPEKYSVSYATFHFLCLT